jgi:hypothetical protein
MSSLDGYELIRGDYYTATVSFTNQSDLVANHPLKVSGFQTAGYAPRFTVKKALNSDEALIEKVLGNGIEIINATTAILEIYPADTKDLKVPLDGLTLYYDFQFASTDGSRVYTMERGSFTITLDASIAAP